MKTVLFIFASFLSHSLFSQENCNNTFIKIFGTTIEDEKGYSLAFSEPDKAIYVAGIKGDSAVIIKIALSGNLEWIRAFDIVPGRQDHIMRILIDSEGMIAAAGIAGAPSDGGTIFIFRYNPVSNKVLWVTEIINQKNFCNGLIQKGSNGNYLVINNPLEPNNLLELIEIDKNTGTVNHQLSKHYDLGGPESLGDALFLNGKIYGIGRFSLNHNPSSFRNTILKLDGDTGNPEWVMLGHKSSSDEARFYGTSLVVDQDNIYSVHCGDENGTSIDQTKIFVQKTTVDRDLIWIKEYDIPGDNDWVEEIIKSDNGYVILARNRTAPSDLILFKINDDGNVLWARKFDYTNNDNSIPFGSIQSQLVEADQHLYFTAFSETSFLHDMIIVKTDLNGNVSDTCHEMTPLSITAKTIQQITWFSWDLDVKEFNPDIKIHQPREVKTTTIQTSTVCQLNSSTLVMVNASICLGDQYEGYSTTGHYTDHFVSFEGCDSVRMLNLEVTNLVSTINDIVICYGEEYEGYSKSGIYTDSFISYFGCDSIRQLILNIKEPITTFIQATLCEDNLSAYLVAGEYIDTLQSINGCDSIRTLVIDGVSKYIPNVFSPNNDGINDEFKIFQFPDYSFDLQYFGIFDRSGNMTYETTSWPIIWDGTGKNGVPNNPGVFAYVLIYHCGKEIITETGDISLLR